MNPLHLHLLLPPPHPHMLRMQEGRDVDCLLAASRLPAPATRLSNGLSSSFPSPALCRTRKAKLSYSPKKEDERERPAFLHSLLSPLSRERSSATTRYRVRCGVLLEGREGDYASGIQKCEEEERQARPLQKSISLEFAYMGCVRTVPEEKSFQFF